MYCDDVSDGGEDDINNIHRNIWTKHLAVSHMCVFTYSSLHVFVSLCGTDGKVKDSESCSDHILTAVPADAASCYWDLAGDLKLFTHFP